MCVLIYIDSVFQILDPKLSELSQVLEGDNEAYHFNKQQYFEHAEHLKESRIAIESSWNTMMKKRKQPQDWIEDLPYEKRTDKRVMKDVAINAYSSKNGRNEYQLYFENYHLNNVEIVGFVMDSDEPYISLLNELITIGAFETSAKSDSCILQEAVKKVIFRASNNPEQFIQKGVISWSNPRGWSTRMKLATNAKTVSPYFKLEDGKAVIAGRTVIIELLYIPDSLSLVIEAGSQIVFQNGGGLIVSNSVDILGTESKPVHIQCTDSTSQGITILNGDYANINHVFISGLSSLSYDGWGFSSALTIYETSTTFNQISMTNNMAKKDLNLIRCNFKFSSGSFKDSFEGETILDFSFEDSNEQP